jgi:hypothetical protein
MQIGFPLRVSNFKLPAVCTLYCIVNETNKIIMFLPFMQIAIFRLQQIIENKRGISKQSTKCEMDNDASYSGTYDSDYNCTAYSSDDDVAGRDHHGRWLQFEDEPPFTVVMYIHKETTAPADVVDEQIEFLLAEQDANEVHVVQDVGLDLLIPMYMFSDLNDIFLECVD